MLRAASHLNDGLDGLRDSRAEMQPSGTGDEAGPFMACGGKPLVLARSRTERYGISARTMIYRNEPAR